MIRGIFILTVFLLNMWFTASGNELFDAANEDYRSGNYTAAIQKYESLLLQDAVPQVYYNLGNACYKTGDYTRAILNYERALRLDPTDADIRHNLDIANLNTTDKIEASPEFFLLTWWKSLSMKQSADNWTIIFLLLLWIGIGCFLVFALANTSFRKLLFLSGLGGTLTALIFLLLALTRHHYDTADDSAVIMTPSVSVKSAPLNSGKDLFIIHQGLKVMVLDSENGWLKICLPDDKQGWIPGEMAEVI